MVVLKLIESLIYMISSIVGTSEQKSSKKSSGSVVNTSNLFSGRNVKRSIRFTKFFPVLFDSNTVKGVGLDYLSIGFDNTKNNDGLKRISGEDFLSRINSETLRYFKDINPDINVNTGKEQITSKDDISNTSFSYLSPARIDFPRKSISLLDHVIIPASKSKKNRILENINDGNFLKKEKFSQMHSAILSQNLTTKPIASMYENYGKSKPVINQKQNAIEEILDQILSDYASVTTNPITLEAKKDEGATILRESPQYVPTENAFFGKLVDPITINASTTQKQSLFHEADNAGKNIFMQSLSVGLVTNGATNKKSNGTQVFSKPLKSIDLGVMLDPNKLVVMQQEQGPKVISGFLRPMSEEKIKSLPNHLKSIMLYNVSNGSVKLEKFAGVNSPTATNKIENAAENKFNFEMLKQLERLTGYTASKNGIIMSKKPIWKILTKKDYDSLNGKEIVCRMISYENKDIGLVNNKGIEIPSYDNYFILIPKKVTNVVPTLIKPEPIQQTKLMEKIQITLTENLPSLSFGINQDSKKASQNLIVNLSSAFTLFDTDKTATQTVTKENKNKVVVRGKNIEVLTDLAVDAIILNCQSNLVEPVYLSNNLISNKSFKTFISEPTMLNTILRTQIDADPNEDKCSAFGKFGPNNTFLNNNNNTKASTVDNVLALATLTTANSMTAASSIATMERIVAPVLPSPPKLNINNNRNYGRGK